MVSLCTSYLFSNGSDSLCARLLRLQYFTLASETREIINMTCQTIEHNDLSLIPSARESLMFLLQKIDLNIAPALNRKRKEQKGVKAHLTRAEYNSVLHMQHANRYTLLHTRLFTAFLGVILWKSENNALKEISYMVEFHLNQWARSTLSGYPPQIVV